MTNSAWQPSFGPVAAPDAEARRRAAARLREVLGVDADAGRLGDLACWWAGVRGCCPAPAPARIRAVVLDACSDPGSKATPARGEPGAVGAVALGAARASLVRVVASLSATAPATPGHDPIAPVLSGQRLADAEVDAGADLLVVAAAPTARRLNDAAATVTAALLAKEPVDVVGTRVLDGKVDDAAWMAGVAAVREGLRAVRHAATAFDAAAVLRAVDAPGLGVLAGLIGQAAARRTPVLLDGVAACAAALVAVRWQPEVAGWLCAGSRPTTRAGRLALDAVDVEPVLDLGLHLEDAAGALLVVPLLRAAVELLGEEEVGVEAGEAGVFQPVEDRVDGAT